MKKIYVLLITLFAFMCSDRSQKTITIINPIQVTSSESVRNGIDILIEDYPNFLHGKQLDWLRITQVLLGMKEKIMRYLKKIPM